jgi:hypothetical protein
MDSLTKLMAERFDQSATQVKAVSDRLTRVESKHEEMASVISKLQSGPPGLARGTGVDGGRTCFKCGSPDHVVQDCPKGKPKVAEEATKAKEE